MNPSTYFNLPKRRKESVQETVRLSVQKILAEEKDKIIEDAKEKIIAEERAYWVAKLAQLEAKIDARDAGKVAPYETQCVDNPHVSGHGSCSQTADVGTDDGLVEEPVNHVDGKSVKKVLEDMEQNLLRNRKGSKTVRQKVDKTMFKPQHENEVMKMAKKANSNVEEKVVVDELEGDQEKENGKESAKPNCVQEHEVIEYVDLTTRGDKSKVCWFPVHFKVEF